MPESLLPVCRLPRCGGRPAPARLLGGALLLLGGLIGGAVLTFTALQRASQGRVSVANTGPTVEQIQELADLIVLRIQIADVLEAEHSAGASMAVLVRGDCDLTIDLSRAAIANRDDDRKTATVKLPLPQPVRPRVDHERTRIYRIERTTWIPWRDPRADLHEQAMAEAQKLVEAECGKPEQITRAQRHAEALIRSFYHQLGWDVAVAWQGE